MTQTSLENSYTCSSAMVQGPTNTSDGRKEMNVEQRQRHGSRDSYRGYQNTSRHTGLDQRNYRYLIVPVFMVEKELIISDLRNNQCVAIKEYQSSVTVTEYD